MSQSQARLLWTTFYIYICIQELIVLLILDAATLICRTAKLCLLPSRFLLAGVTKSLVPVLSRFCFLSVGHELPFYTCCCRHHCFYCLMSVYLHASIGCRALQSCQICWSSLFFSFWGSWYWNLRYKDEWLNLRMVILFLVSIKKVSLNHMKKKKKTVSFSCVLHAKKWCYSCDCLSGFYKCFCNTQI